MSCFLFISPTQQKKKNYFLSIFNSRFEQIGPNCQIFVGVSVRYGGSTNLGHEDSAICGGRSNWGDCQG